MFKFIEFLQKRPSDRTILNARMIFGVVIALLLGLNFSDITLNLPESLKMYGLQIQYGLFIFAVVPFFMGATGICLAKRKYVRIIQIIFGIVLLVVGNALIDMKNAPTPESQSVQTQNTGALDYKTVAETTTPHKSLNVGFWIALLGIFPLGAGITGKCITSKCIKYKEIIKKIRV